MILLSLRWSFQIVTCTVYISINVGYCFITNVIYQKEMENCKIILNFEAVDQKHVYVMNTQTTLEWLSPFLQYLEIRAYWF